MRRFLLFLLILAGTAAPAAAQAPASAPAGDAGYYFLLARHLENSGQIDEALAALRAAMGIEPRSAELRAELAGLYARQDRAVEAMTAAEEALAIDPANREAHRTLGTIYAALSEQKQKIRPGDDPATYAAKAMASLERARGETRGDLGVEFSLGRLYLRAGQHDQAIEALGRVFEEQPEYAEGGLLLAAAQKDAGRVEDATKTVEMTLQVNPAFFRGYIELIELYERQRRWTDAARAYALAAQVNSQADLAGGHAAALLTGGQPRQAQELLEPVIAKKPADAGLLYLLAESQRQQKNYAAAATTAQKLRATFPDDARGYVMEAQLHLAQGRQAEAITAFAELVKRVPGEPTFVYQYAQLLERAGRAKEAEAALRQLLDRDPLDANALNSLGYLLADRGERLDEAVELLQRANKIEPGNASFLDSLGWAFYKQGRLDQADGPLSEAAQKSPENSVIQDHLGDLRVRQQRFAEAAVAFERALAGDGEDIERAVIEKKLRDARARIRTP